MAGFSGRAHWTAAITAAAALALACSACSDQSAPAASASVVAGAVTPSSGKQAPTRPLEKPLWKELTPAQQQALEPLRPEWDQLEPVRKKKWLDIANRYSSMSSDEQGRVHDRMREWVKLTPEERRQVRQNFARAQKIGPGQKSAQWEEYQQLPEEQKKKLAAEAAVKKQVVNLPTPSQNKIKTAAPIKPAPAPPAVLAGTPPVAAPAAVAGASAVGAIPVLPPASNVAPVPLTPAAAAAAAAPAGVAPAASPMSPPAPATAAPAAVAPPANVK